MIKIPSVYQIRELDAQTIEDEGICSLDLMERAAQAVADAIAKRWGSGTRLVVFAGPGNNGGDALAVARIMSSRSYPVEVYLFNTRGELSPDCLENKKRLEACPDVKFTEVTAQFGPPALTSDTVVVDGLFGTGLNKPLSGGYALLVRLLNDSQAKVVSIDVPSGMLCESTSNDEAIVRAYLTLTFQMPKLSMYCAETAPYYGEIDVLNIGLSAKRLQELETDHIALEDADVKKLIVARSPFAHKGTFGHALLIAGKYGMAGAAILSARACLRSGVGKLTVHSPQMNNSILQIAVPEAVLSHDVADTVFATAVPANNYDAVAIGPGLGTDSATAAAFINQVTQTSKPLVIDADGINMLSDHNNWLSLLPAKTILTPHPAELRRLIHRQANGSALLGEARSMAIERNLYIVLKGHYTAICTPEGKVYFNATGNSGMATAGSGDVLTGIIAAMLAQHYSPLTACLIAVYLHGLAGDLVAEQLTEYGVIASDIVDYLPAAFKSMSKS